MAKLRLAAGSEPAPSDVRATDAEAFSVGRLPVGATGKLDIGKCQKSVDALSGALENRLRYGMLSMVKTMPTIEDLVAAGAISRIEVEMQGREQFQRLLYGTPGFIIWLQSLLDGAAPPHPLGFTSAAEQVDQLFHSYLSGAPLILTRQFRYIRAEKNAVWELKTPDARIFGWFMKKDCFVCVYGDWADRVKDHDLYRGYRIAIRRLRRELNADDNLCIQGVNPSDVLSI